MSAADDLAAIAGTASTIAAQGDGNKALVALGLIAHFLPDLVDRVRALENTTVPPHWRRQPWDGQPFGNVRLLRRNEDESQ